MSKSEVISRKETRIKLTEEQQDQILHLIKEGKSTNLQVEIEFEADLIKRSIVPATVMVGMAI